MTQFAQRMGVWQQRMMRRIADRVEDRERGDVPGWVLITIMTAGLVTVIWQLAGPQLSEMFQNALKGVSGKK